MKLNAAEYDIANKVRKVWEEAQAIYQLDNDLTVNFANNASIAATGRRMGNMDRKHAPAALAVYDRQEKRAIVYLNRRAIKQHWSHMHDEVVPHEVAHIVCILKPHFGDGHDDGWKEVCIRLGGTGCVTYDTQFDLRVDRMARKQYIYRTRKGNVRISQTWHDNIQHGTPFVGEKSGITIVSSDYTGVWV